MLVNDRYSALSWSVVLHHISVYDIDFRAYVFCGCLMSHGGHIICL